MLNLEELEQLIAFDDCGTLSKAAEQLHISQPTITRTMQHVEEDFGVPLFERGKNKIAFNETGKQAVAAARKLLKEAENTVQAIRDFDRRQHTITVESCAPAPLWSLLPKLSSEHPGNMINSSLSECTQIIQDVKSGQADIGILACPCPESEADELKDQSYIREQLSVCVPYSHALAKYDQLSFADLNGFNCLVRDDIGFWEKLCYEKMPASRFLIQTNEFEMEELIRTSTLLCFTTNCAEDRGDLYRGRKIIPLTDADVTYHLIRRK